MEMFGEQALIRKDRLELASIKATEECHLAVLDIESWQRISQIIRKVKLERRINFLR